MVDAIFGAAGTAMRYSPRRGLRPMTSATVSGPPFGHLLYQLAQTLLQPRIRQLRGRQFPLDPVLAATRLRIDCPFRYRFHDNCSLHVGLL
jgi:hypothetical protein